MVTKNIKIIGTENSILKEILSFLCCYCSLAVLGLSIASFVCMSSCSYVYDCLFKHDPNILRGIIWALFALFFASFFTALSITLNKPAVSILAYFKFQKGIELLVNSGSVFFFIVWSFFIQYGKSSVIDSVLYVHGLVLLLLSFIESLYAMHVISDKNDLLISFIKKVNNAMQSIGFKDGYNQGSISNPVLYDSYCNFCVKCLNSIDGLPVKHNIYSIINECLEHLDSSNTSRFLSFFVAMRNNVMFQCDKRNNNDDDFGFYEKSLLASAISKDFIGTDFEGVLRIYLDHYREWTLKRVLNKSHILTIRDALFFKYKDYGRLSEERKKQLIVVLNECRMIIQYSFFYCDKDIVESIINDYCQLIQFHRHSEQDVFSCFYDNVTAISIWIIACRRSYRLKNKDDFDYIVFPLIYNHVFKMKLREISFELYPEVLPRTDFHEEQYSYEYYLSVLLVYICAVLRRNHRMHRQEQGTEREPIECFFDERVFESLDFEDQYNTCQTLLIWVGKIAEDDYFLTDVISLNESIIAQEILLEVLMKKSRATRALIIQSALSRTKLDDERKKIEKQFVEIGINKTELAVSDDEITIRSNIILSEKPSLNIVNYAHAMLDDIIISFDQRFGMKEKDDKTVAISFENLLQKSSGIVNSLIVPEDVYSLIYEKEIPGIEYTGTGIKYNYNESERTISLRMCNVSFVYDEKEVLNSLSIKKIQFEIDKKQAIEDTASLSVPFFIILSCDFSKIKNRYYVTGLS